MGTGIDDDIKPIEIHKFKKTLKKAKEIRKSVDQIQNIQAGANQELNHLDEKLEKEVKKAVIDAPSLTPNDPMGKRAIAKIRARYKVAHEKLEHETSIKLAASKKKLSEQLLRRRQRFQSRR